MKPHTSRKGFTLIELLVVIAIIGILATVVMAALGESRERSRNAARAVQVREYQKALNMHYSDLGYYPRVNGTTITSTACLGDYAPIGTVGGTCWQDGTSILERSWFVSAITPQYMGSVHNDDNTVFGTSPTYTGMYYQYSSYGKAYTLRYFMKGNDMACMVDNATGSNVGGDTLCTLTVQP